MEQSKVEGQTEDINQLSKRLSEAEKSRARLQQAVMNGQRLNDALDSNDKLRDQLAAERELRKRWERKTEEVLSQLAAAKAAIADASDLIEHADPASLSSPLRDKLTDILSSTPTLARIAITRRKAQNASRCRSR